MVRKPSSPTGSLSAAAATATLLQGDDHINVRLNGKVGKGASPSLWSHSDVAAWLRDAGFAHYAQLLAETHKIDGASLLQLSESDLREPPLSMSCLGDIKRLGHALQALRDAEEARKRNELFLLHCDNGVDVAAVISDDDVMDTLSTSGTVRLMSRDSLIRHVESPDTRAKSVLKLAIAAGYCAASLLITALVMVLVHDRVPDMKTYPPLPDIVLDNLPLIPWAFEACECIGVVLSGIWFTVLFFHKQRVVIARRMFSMVGTVFLLRCITMLITSLSVPGVHLECSAKSFGSTSDKFWQALKIWSKLGMSIQGVRTCGDYMFSGHTTAITLLNHFITEYTPSSWTGLHTMTWVMNLFGVFFILAGHEHYSIDVFIAFYISSRMFLYYHAYAYNHANLTATDDRMRLWFPLGWFFEAGSVGKCPNEFEVPFSIKGTKRRILSLLGVGSGSERDREHDRFYPASPRHGDDVRFGVETRSTKARQAMKKKNK